MSAHHETVNSFGTADIDDKAMIFSGFLHHDASLGVADCNEHSDLGPGPLDPSQVSGGGDFESLLPYDAPLYPRTLVQMLELGLDHAQWEDHKGVVPHPSTGAEADWVTDDSGYTESVVAQPWGRSILKPHFGLSSSALDARGSGLALEGVPFSPSLYEGQLSEEPFSMAGLGDDFRGPYEDEDPRSVFNLDSSPYADELLSRASLPFESNPWRPDWHEFATPLNGSPEFSSTSCSTPNLTPTHGHPQGRFAFPPLGRHSPSYGSDNSEHDSMDALADQSEPASASSARCTASGGASDINGPSPRRNARRKSTAGRVVPSKEEASTRKRTRRGPSAKDATLGGKAKSEGPVVVNVWMCFYLDQSGTKRCQSHFRRENDLLRHWLTVHLGHEDKLRKGNTPIEQLPMMSRGFQRTSHVCDTCGTDCGREDTLHKHYQMPYGPNGGQCAPNDPNTPTTRKRPNRDTCDWKDVVPGPLKKRVRVRKACRTARSIEEELEVLEYWRGTFARKTENEKQSIHLE